MTSSTDPVFWHHPEFSRWMDNNSNLQCLPGATYALDTKGCAVEQWWTSNGCTPLILKEDAIKLMRELGGHVFFKTASQAFLSWPDALVKLDFVTFKKVQYLGTCMYTGMENPLHAKLMDISSGWFGRKIRVRKTIPPTTLHMLAKIDREYRLISIGDETEPLVPENYDPKVVEAFEYCKESLLSDKPNGRLILMDGPPGTGKTRMVRALMGSLHNVSTVIVVPEHLTAEIADPELIPVLKEAANESSVVLIMEDADDCLASRDTSEVRGSARALASLLNLSDGIVGAMLDLRIFATTNIHIEKMDAAVMRPGRLLSRIEFRELSVSQAQSIMRRLTKNNPVAPMPQMPATLAEVYAMATTFLRENP